MRVRVFLNGKWVDGTNTFFGENPSIEINGVRTYVEYKYISVGEMSADQLNAMGDWHLTKNKKIGFGDWGNCLDPMYNWEVTEVEDPTVEDLHEKLVHNTKVMLDVIINSNNITLINRKDSFINEIREAMDLTNEPGIAERIQKALNKMTEANNWYFIQTLIK